MGRGVVGRGCCGSRVVCRGGYEGKRISGIKCGNTMWFSLVYLSFRTPRPGFSLFEWFSV